MCVPASRTAKEISAVLFTLMAAALLVTVVIAILTIVVSISDGVRWTEALWERLRRRERD